MTEIPEAIYSRAREALAYAQTALSSGEPERAVEIIAREIMEAERNGAHREINGVSHVVTSRGRVHTDFTLVMKADYAVPGYREYAVMYGGNGPIHSDEWRQRRPPEAT